LSAQLLNKVSALEARVLELEKIVAELQKQLSRRETLKLAK